MTVVKMSSLHQNNSEAFFCQIDLRNFDQFTKTCIYILSKITSTMNMTQQLYQ